MSNRLPANVIADIRKGFANGDGLRAIARNLGISTNTVRRYAPAPEDRGICACGQPKAHTGLCKERYAASLGLQAYRAKRLGNPIDYVRPPARSRRLEARAKAHFMFGIEEGWEKRAKRLDPSETYGIIGEVHLHTRHLKPEHRDDVRQEMILACIEGRLPRAEIKRMVGPFLMREQRNWIGAIHSIYYSLDATHGDHGRTYLDLLADGLIDEDDLWRVSAKGEGLARRAA